MKENKNILGCFVSGPTLTFGGSEEEDNYLLAQGELFRSYIWGPNGISNFLKQLNYENYGTDIELILFQFYAKPSLLQLESLKEMENYRKKEKAIGVNIIVTDDNFFNKSETERILFLKKSIAYKLDLLSELVKKKRLDTKVDLIKSDLEKIW